LAFTAIALNRERGGKTGKTTEKKTTTGAGRQLNPNAANGQTK